MIATLASPSSSSTLSVEGGRNDAKPAVLISELAGRLGTTPRALRYYEELGLISPQRTPGGARLYDMATFTRARRVVALRRLGLTSDQIAACIGLDAHDEASSRKLRFRLEALLARSLQDCQDLEIAIGSLAA